MPHNMFGYFFRFRIFKYVKGSTTYHISLIIVFVFYIYTSYINVCVIMLCIFILYECFLLIGLFIIIFVIVGCSFISGFGAGNV